MLKTINPSALHDTQCPRCARFGTLRLTRRFVAVPVGPFALSAAPRRMSGNQTVVTCTDCTMIAVPL